MSIWNKRTIAVCVVLGLLAGCSGDGNPVSGHQAGTRSPKMIKDVGDIRVRVSQVISARNFKIPKTYAFAFSWTPEAYIRQNKRRDLRTATSQDWVQYEVHLAKTNKRLTAKNLAGIMRLQRKRARRTEFKPVVGKNGALEFCNDSWGGKYGCSTGLSLSKSKQRQLAKFVLTRLERGCTIGTIDPPQVAALRPGIKSGRLSVVATIDCVN